MDCFRRSSEALPRTGTTVPTCDLTAQGRPSSAGSGGISAGLSSSPLTKGRNRREMPVDWPARAIRGEIPMTHATRKRLAARALLAAAVLSAIVSGAEAGQKHRLFVSNLDGSINIYSANIHDTDVALLGTITAGATRPEGIWIDGDGTLYLVNGEGGTGAPDIAEYKKGASQPFRTISNGLYYPGFVAVGSDGTVYVNSVDGDSTGMVIEYAPGKTRPERTITLPDPAYALAPGGMAFDAGGNLLVATLGNVSTVHV